MSEWHRVLQWVVNAMNSLLKASNPNRALTQHLCEAFDANIMSNDSIQRQCVGETETSDYIPNPLTREKIKTKPKTRQ